MIHLGFDVPCSNQLIVSPLFRGNSPYPTGALPTERRQNTISKADLSSKIFPPWREGADRPRRGAALCSPAAGGGSRGRRKSSRDPKCSIGGAVRPPALRQPSEIKNSFVQWTKEFSWQREKDSNPHIRSQSPLCYPYTIPLCSQRTDIIIAAFSNLSIGK